MNFSVRFGSRLFGSSVAAMALVVCAVVLPAPAQARKPVSSDDSAPAADSEYTRPKDPPKADDADKSDDAAPDDADQPADSDQGGDADKGKKQTAPDTEDQPADSEYPRPKKVEAPPPQPADEGADDDATVEEAPKKPADTGRHKRKPAPEDDQELPAPPPARPPPEPIPAPPVADLPTPEAPPDQGLPAIPSGEEPAQSVLKIALYGIYDGDSDSIDSDQAREVEASIRKSLKLWWGFELVSEHDLDKTIDKVDRGFVAQAAKPAEKLTMMERQSLSAAGDLGIVGKLHTENGKEKLRLRIITLPDRQADPSAVYEDAWTEEQSLEYLPSLIEHARNESYALANVRVQSMSWANAAIMHIAPPVAFKGPPVRLSANMLCRGDCNLVLHYWFIPPGGSAQPEHTKTMTRDERTHRFDVELKDVAPGKIRYYFSVVSKDRRPLPADISTGTREEPYEVRIAAPSAAAPESEAAAEAPAAASVPKAALESGPTRPSTVPGGVTLAIGGAALIAGVAMAAVTHVWYTSPLTEVQGAQAKSFLAPTYVTVSVGGVLAIIGSVLLAQELNAPPQEAPQRPPEKEASE